jgi:endonuclease YncB( thermonuclease family)
MRYSSCMTGAFAIALAFSSSVLAAQAEMIAGRIVGVTDGDTLRVYHEGKLLRVRLYGIDCPEMKQAGGKEARALARRLAYGRVLLIYIPSRIGRSYRKSIENPLFQHGPVLRGKIKMVNE